MRDKNAPGLNYEQLQKCRDKSISSIRVDRGIRIILRWMPELDAFLFLYVGKHDDAYNWAKRRLVSVNDATGSIQVYVAPDEPAASISSGLFPAERYSDKTLRRLGVPDGLLSLVHSIQDEGQLLEQWDAFPPEVADRLSSLEQWRIFLHPTQRQLVERRFGGPALVLGGAGTGKTITALHRAKALVARMGREKTKGKILYVVIPFNQPEESPKYGTLKVIE